MDALAFSFVFGFVRITGLHFSGVVVQVCLCAVLDSWYFSRLIFLVFCELKCAITLCSVQTYRKSHADFLYWKSHH